MVLDVRWVSGWVAGAGPSRPLRPPVCAVLLISTRPWCRRQPSSQNHTPSLRALQVRAGVGGRPHHQAAPQVGQRALRARPHRRRRLAGGRGGEAAQPGGARDRGALLMLIRQRGGAPSSWNGCASVGPQARRLRRTRGWLASDSPPAAPPHPLIAQMCADGGAASAEAAALLAGAGYSGVQQMEGGYAGYSQVSRVALWLSCRSASVRAAAGDFRPALHRRRGAAVGRIHLPSPGRTPPSDHVQVWSPSGKRRPPAGRWVPTGKEALKRWPRGRGGGGAGLVGRARGRHACWAAGAWRRAEGSAPSPTPAPCPPAISLQPCAGCLLPHLAHPPTPPHHAHQRA